MNPFFFHLFGLLLLKYTSRPLSLISPFTRTAFAWLCFPSTRCRSLNSQFLQLSLEDFACQITSLFSPHIHNLPFIRGFDIERLWRSVVKFAQSIWLFANPWTVAHQAPLSMGFSRQEYLSALPCPPSGYLPIPGIKTRSPTMQADSLLFEPPGKPQEYWGG